MGKGNGVWNNNTFHIISKAISNIQGVDFWIKLSLYICSQHSMESEF